MFTVQRILFEDCGPIIGVRETVVNSYRFDTEAKAREKANWLMAKYRHESPNYWYFIVDVDAQSVILKTNENKYAPKF